MISALILLIIHLLAWKEIISIIGIQEYKHSAKPITQENISEKFQLAMTASPMTKTRNVTKVIPSRVL